MTAPAAATLAHVPISWAQWRRDRLLEEQARAMATRQVSAREAGDALAMAFDLRRRANPVTAGEPK